MRALLVFCFLSGCATTGTQSFSQILATAEAADDAAVVTATNALNAGLISSAQAKKILTITDGVNAALTLANTTYQSGNLSSANAQIAAATAILVKVQQCLATPPAQIDSCLAPVSAP